MREAWLDSLRRRKVAAAGDGASVLDASVDEGRLGRRGDGERVSRGASGGDIVVG